MASTSLKGINSKGSVVVRPDGAAAAAAPSGVEVCYKRDLGIAVGA